VNKVAPADNRSLTIQQVADRWSCHDQSVRKWQKEGLLKGFRIGLRFRFPLSEVLHAEQIMAENPARWRYKADPAERRKTLLQNLAAARVSRKQKLAQKTAVKQKAAVSRL
jgi:excisionase family DNA binding protein